MTKEQLIQLVKDLAGVEFGDRTVAIHLGNVFGSVVGQLFSQDNNQYRYYTKRIILPVENRIANLTIPLIQTKSNANGVLKVSPSNPDDPTEFYPMPPYALNSGADANKLSWAIFYTVTASEVRFNKSLPKGVTSVLADVIPEFQGYNNNDFINLPAGVQQMIIDGAVAAIKGAPAYQNIYKGKK